MSFAQSDATERWDRNATAWRQHFAANDPNRKYIIDPAILSILGDVRENRILDAGCGEGYQSRMLARNGARVTGVDVSARMIELATLDEEREPLGVTYVQGDITRMPILSDSTFDVVLTNVVIDDVDDFGGALGELFRLLRPGGIYVQATVHPCFGTPVAGWVREPEGDLLYRKVDQYYLEGSTGLVHWPDGAGMEPTVSYFRTLSVYFNALVGSGFAVDQMVEPRPSPEAVEEYPGVADELRVPNFLIMICRRPA